MLLIFNAERHLALKMQKWLSINVLNFLKLIISIYVQYVYAWYLKRY
jgi:hypothetical protein